MNSIWSSVSLHTQINHDISVFFCCFHIGTNINFDYYCTLRFLEKEGSFNSPFYSCVLRILGPVVQKVDNAIHRINHCPVDKC